MRLAVIPARGGSKRIPKKNIIDVDGLPMIAHVIKAIQGTGLYDEIHVSTDDTEIAAISRNYGASVPFLRKADLATDSSPVLSVIQWVVKQYEDQGKRFDSILMATPCSPLLDANDFIQATAQFEKSNRKLPMLAVARYPSPIEWALSEKNGVLVAHDAQKLLIRSQDLKPTYYDAGLFCLFGNESLSKNEQVASEFIKFELPRWKAIDIDEWDDLELARKMMKLKHV